MKKVATVLLVSLAALALVACGGSDDDTSSTAAETTAESAGGSGGGGAVETLKFEAAEGSALAYTSDTAESAAGKVEIEFSNPQSISHDVEIEDAKGEDVASTELVSDGTATATAELKPGEYTFYCSVPGHREAGMEGTLTVK